MKKRSGLSRAVVLMLVLTMLALIAIAGTYAKYTAGATGTATAVVGKWDINFLNGEEELSQNFTIDLADTMTSADSTNDFIQPGSSGSFTIKVKNDGQVPAKIVAEVSDSSSSVFTSGQFTLETTGDTEGEGEVVNPKSEKEVTITWSWTYDKDSTGAADTQDTTLGEASDGIATKTLCNITLKATQVDPNA